jgi:hypothetical protein
VDVTVAEGAVKTAQRFDGAGLSGVAQHDVCMTFARAVKSAEER